MHQQRNHPDPLAVAATARKARLDGATQLSYNSTEWDISGSCLEPVPVELAGRLPREYRNRKGDDEFGLFEWTLVPAKKPHYLDMAVPCRKCANCLAYRRALWTARAKAEFSFCKPGRTWFCTLTFSDARWYELSTQAHAHARKNGYPSDAKYVAKLCRAGAYREVQLALKRLRKSGRQFRYMFVPEPHKARDAIHLHGLLHEQDLTMPLTKRLLQSQWEANGFSHFKLSDEGSIGYVTKYLTKGNLGRLKASLFYGSPLTSLSKSLEKRRKVTVCTNSENLERHTVPDASSVSEVIREPQDDRVRKLPMPF
jgi:hypothetical protein